MRTLLILLAGVLIGAAGFHAYYLQLGPADRCGWDHPLSSSARAGCRVAHAGGYGAADRRAMDRLIDAAGR